MHACTRIGVAESNQAFALPLGLKDGSDEVIRRESACNLNESPLVGVEAVCQVGGIAGAEEF